MNENPGHGRHIEIWTPSNIERMKQLLDLGHRLFIRDVAYELSINHETVHLIVKDELHLQKLCANLFRRIVPRNRRNVELMFAVIGSKQLSQKTFSNVW